MRTIQVRNNQRSPVHCSVPCIIELPAVCSKLWSPDPPPPPHTFLKWPFHTDFKKYTYTPPPQGNDISAHRMKSSKTLGKRPKPTELAQTECPRETCACTHTHTHKHTPRVSLFRTSPRALRTARSCICNKSREHVGERARARHPGSAPTRALSPLPLMCGLVRGPLWRPFVAVCKRLADVGGLRQLLWGMQMVGGLWRGFLPSDKRRSPPGFRQPPPPPDEPQH